MQWCTNWTGRQRYVVAVAVVVQSRKRSDRDGTDRARRANNSKVFLAQSPSTYALKRRRRTNQFCAPLCVRCPSSQQEGRGEVWQIPGRRPPGVRLSLPSDGFCPIHTGRQYTTPSLFCTARCCWHKAHLPGGRQVMTV